MSYHLALGLTLSVTIAAAALRVGALTGSGAGAAVLIGTCVFYAGGFRWSVPVLVFFITSSALTNIPVTGASSMKFEDILEKRRNAAQVLANGGIPAVFALLMSVHAASAWQIGFAAGLCAAAADTWSTEIGRHSKRLPIDLRTGRRVAKGTSGAVSLRGFLGAALGSMTVGATAYLALEFGLGSLITAVTCGCSGALVDSILGAFFQERRYCQRCALVCEDRIHRQCKAATTYVRGVHGLTNNKVNMLSCATASLLAVLFHLLLGL